jgi:hypothetical protein
MYFRHPVKDRCAVCLFEASCKEFNFRFGQLVLEIMESLCKSFFG